MRSTCRAPCPTSRNPSRECRKCRSLPDPRSAAPLQQVRRRSGPQPRQSRASYRVARRAEMVAMLISVSPLAVSSSVWKTTSSLWSTFPTVRQGLSRSSSEIAAANGSVNARDVSERHRPGTLTLVVLNTMERSRLVHHLQPPTSADLVPLHSRFRPADRKEACRRIARSDRRRRPRPYRRLHAVFDAGVGANAARQQLPALEGKSGNSTALPRLPIKLESVLVVRHVDLLGRMKRVLFISYFNDSNRALTELRRFS